ncbi:FAD-dependent monooxygenase [soil metagenome]
MSEQPITIVGAGIGGLVLGIALQQRGMDVVIYEAADVLDEVGAGVALWSNATRLLHRLGLADDLAEHGSEPTELIFRDGINGERIADVNLTGDNWYRQEFGAPYYGIHRKALQKILAEALKPGTIKLGHRLDRIEEIDADTTRLHWAKGTFIDAGLVVAADGIRSGVRTWMSDGLDHNIYSRTSGFRGVVPMDAIPSMPDPTAVQFWVGDGAHLLHFPIGPDYKFATFLAVEEDPKVWPNREAWRVPTTREEAVERFAGWHPAITEMIGAVDHTERWGLFGVGPLKSWTRNNVVLLGDAAHGLLPHHGQGANQCMEDAFVLTELLVEEGDASLHDRLRRYEEIRMGRAQQVQKISWVSNRLFHLPAGPEIPLRDETFRNVLDNVRWIHEYDAQAAVAPLHV